MSISTLAYAAEICLQAVGKGDESGVIKQFSKYPGIASNVVEHSSM